MDPAVKKRVLRIPDYDLAIVGARAAKVEDPKRDLNAFLGSWFTQTSFDPPLVALAVRKDARSNAMIRESGVFVLNLLASDQKPVATAFLRDVVVEDDRMSGVPFRAGRTGAPCFPSMAGFVECEVRHAWDGGDHTLFVGEVVEAGLGEGKPEPLTTKNTGWTYAG